MKEKDAFVDYREHQLILYVEKEDGGYGSLRTGSYLARNYLDFYRQQQARRKEHYLKKLRDGEINPIGYYMLLENMTLSELAGRVKLSKGKVKKHLKPGYFIKIKPEILKRYADIFNLSVEDLSGLLKK